MNKLRFFFYFHYLNTGYCCRGGYNKCVLCDSSAESTVIVGSNNLCWLPQSLSKEFPQVFPTTTCRNESKNYLTEDFEGRWSWKGGKLYLYYNGLPHLMLQLCINIMLKCLWQCGNNMQHVACAAPAAAAGPAATTKSALAANKFVSSKPPLPTPLQRSVA